MENGHNISEETYVIAGFGNPLLDICVAINDNELLDKFNLQPDGQKEVCEMEMKAMLSYLFGEENELSYYAGGAAQNTLRIIQQLIKTPSFTVFFGGCGVDKQSEILLAQLERYCVKTRYAIHKEQPTGTVISLINKPYRSLVAHLGAANIYTLQDFQSKNNIKIIQNVSYVYIEGFFLSHSFIVALEVAKICRQNGNIIVFNLSGAYLFEKNASEVATLVSLADIVLGNCQEFQALGDFLKIPKSSIRDLLSVIMTVDYKQYISDDGDFIRNKQYKCEQMIEYKKMLVCTDGKNAVHAIYENTKFITFCAPYLDPTLIIDTTGAGDAFAAGFIVGFMKKMSLNNCLELGCKTACKVIQSVGCTLTDS